MKRLPKKKAAPSVVVRKPTGSRPVVAPKSLKAIRKPPATELSLPTKSMMISDLEVVLSNLQKNVLGYRRGLWNAIAIACAIAAFLQENEEGWAAFCGSEVWKTLKSRPDSEKPDEALRHVCIWACGERGKKRASKWYNAVAPLMDEGVQPDEIPDAIEEAGGIEELSRQNAARKRQAKETFDPPPGPSGKLTLGVEKRVLPKKMAIGVAKPLKNLVKRGPPLDDAHHQVTLIAMLEEEAMDLLSWPVGAYGELKIELLGHRKGEFKIAIMNAQKRVQRNLV